MMKQRALELELLPGSFAVARLDPEEEIPAWAAGDLLSYTWTQDELSIVCPEVSVPAGVESQRGFRCFQVVGPLAFSEIGVLASLANPLAEAGVSIFVLSTYATDYLLLPSSALESAIKVLSEAGHSVRGLGVDE